ncbi:MAG: PH domain-containing protein [Hyphomonadaceae bacterium]
MSSSVTYCRRRNALSRGAREWRVEPGGLTTRGAGGRERTYPWSEIVSVRLCHEPARRRPWRYVLELQPRHRRKIVIDNCHFSGAEGFEEQSEAYVTFVRAVIAALAAENPKLRVLIGETPKRYFVLLLLALLGLGALAFALIALPTPIDAWPYAALLKLGLVLLMLPLFWGWVIRAVPRGVSPGDIPERALPPGRAGATGGQ